VARYGKWKAVVLPKATSILLYDLENDPEQKENVADQHPDIIRQVTRSAAE
jgi:arylsulfatase A-like enzyme